MHRYMLKEINLHFLLCSKLLTKSLNYESKYLKHILSKIDSSKSKVNRTYSFVNNTNVLTSLTDITNLLLSSNKFL